MRAGSTERARSAARNALQAAIASLAGVDEPHDWFQLNGELASARRSPVAELVSAPRREEFPS